MKQNNATVQIMPQTQDTATIFSNVAQGQYLTREEAEHLLSLPLHSQEYYQLLYYSNQYSRATFPKGLIFGQLGMDARDCSGNCKFCSFSKDQFDPAQAFVKTKAEVVAEVKRFLQKDGLSELFLMATADFDPEEFLQYGKAVREILPSHIGMVANTTDFDLAYGKRLVEAGFSGVYHVHRLGEGVDTDIVSETRIATLDCLKEAGLLLYYCVEPIAPHHSNDELLTEMFRAKDYPVEVMAVMKRVSVGSAQSEVVSSARLAQICAVSNLVVRPSRAMCVHEPDLLCLMAGANQLYAEFGTNPRDGALETRENRAYSVEAVKDLFFQTGWEV